MLKRCQYAVICQECKTHLGLATCLAARETTDQNGKGQNTTGSAAAALPVIRFFVNALGAILLAKKKTC